MNPALDSRIDQMVQSGLSIYLFCFEIGRNTLIFRLGLKKEIEQMREITSMLGGKMQMSGLNQAIGGCGCLVCSSNRCPYSPQDSKSSMPTLRILVDRRSSSTTE